jgi:hypothetical protein
MQKELGKRVVSEQEVKEKLLSIRTPKNSEQDSNQTVS